MADSWRNRLYWLGGVNQNCRWMGECKCGFNTTPLGFQSAEKSLREHIASCAIYKVTA